MDTAYSDDDGETWTEYKNHWPSFDGAEKKHTIVAMASLVQLKDEQEITFRNGWVFSMIMVMSTSRAI